MDQDPLPRRAAYLSMAMLNTVKVGITDLILVRNAAFFALGQFSEHLQSDITKFASQNLPILCEFLHQLCNESRRGGAEAKHIDRMLYALETFCDNLEDEMKPYLSVLIKILFEALNPNNSVRLRSYLAPTEKEGIISLRP